MSEQKLSFDEMSFNEASLELERVIRMLESNQLELEESLEAYERGVALVRALKVRLNEAEQKVETLLGEIEPEADEQIDTRLS